MSVHEQARAEAEKRRPETGDLTEYQHTRNEGWRDGFEDGYVAGHEAATRTLTSDPDFDQEFAQMRGKLDAVRKVADTLRNDCEYHESREFDAAEIRTVDGWRNVVDGWRNVDDYAADVLAILDGKTGD